MGAEGTKIGPIQPHPYGWEGDKRVNYTRNGEKHSCRISHGGLHLMLDDGWYTTKLLADLDPADAEGKGKREYIKDTLDAVDWDNLDKYPNNAVGVNMEDLITAESGSKKCYLAKVGGVPKGGIKLIWAGDGGQGVTLKGLTDNDSELFTPSEVTTDDGEVLAKFDYETMHNRGFRMVNWWVVPRQESHVEVHVVMAHMSAFAQ